MIILANPRLHRIALTYVSDNIQPEDMYNEEISVNKQTAMLSVKTPVDGAILSYDYTTRLESHIDRIIHTTMSNGIIKGMVVMIEPDDIKLPASNTVVDIDLIGDQYVDVGYGLSNMIISIDMDCTEIVDREINKDYRYDIMVEYTVVTQMNGYDINTYTGMQPLSQINNNCIVFSELNDNVQIRSLKIHSIPDKTLRYTVYSICAFIRKNEFYKISALNVLQQHTNIQIVGTKFDRTGLIVEGVRSNGTSEIVTDYDTEVYPVENDGD